MKLIKRNKNLLKLLIETKQDLWMLTEFINFEDIIFSKTLRKVRIGGDDSKNQVKKIIFVRLKVLKVNFNVDVLKISGIILNETEFTSIGQSHCLNFKVNDIFEIEKKEILKYEEKNLNRMIRSKNFKNLIVLLDRDEMIGAEVFENDFSIIFQVKGLGKSKFSNEKFDENLEKFKVIENELKKKYHLIIFCGPGFFKDSLKKYILTKMKIKIETFQFGEVSSFSFPKLIKELTKNKIILKSIVGIEVDVVNKLLKLINLNKKSCYGFSNSKESCYLGNCEILLISTKFLFEKKENQSFNEILELFGVTEELNSEIIIIESKNESGKIIDGLGGIAVIKRY